MKSGWSGGLASLCVLGEQDAGSKAVLWDSSRTSPHLIVLRQQTFSSLLSQTFVSIYQILKNQFNVLIHRELDNYVSPSHASGKLGFDVRRQF